MADVVRGGDGRFRRDVVRVERDARACALAARGWTYQAIADECGYASKQAAHIAVQRALVATARSTGTEELRERQLQAMDELCARAWEIVDNPPPAFDRVGRVVTGEDGRPVVDAAAWSQAASVVIRASERAARLRGLDAPKVSVQASLASMTPAELRALAALPADKRPVIPLPDIQAMTADVKRQIAELEAVDGPAVIEGRVED